MRLETRSRRGFREKQQYDKEVKQDMLRASVSHYH
jgi:hypothetical protein